MTTLHQRRIEGVSFLPSSLFHEKKECTKDDAYSSDTSTPSTSRRSWRRKQRKDVVAKKEMKESRRFRTRFSLRSSRSRNSEQHPTSQENPVDALPSGTDGIDEEGYVVHFMGSFLFKVSPRSDKPQNPNSASEDECCNNRSDELNDDCQNEEEQAREEAKRTVRFTNDHEEKVDTAKVANATTMQEKVNDEAPAETTTETSRGQKSIEISVAETTSLDQLPPTIAKSNDEKVKNNDEKEVHAEEPPRRTKMTVRSCLLLAATLFSISALYYCQMTHVTDSLSSLYAGLSDSKRHVHNGLCAPIRLRATTTRTSSSEWGAATDAVFVAPWWAPMPFKNAAFALFCADGNRVQTRVQVQGKKVRIFSVETNKMVWGSRHGVVQIGTNRLIKGCKEIKAPWAV